MTTFVASELLILKVSFYVYIWIASAQQIRRKLTLIPHSSDIKFNVHKLLRKVKLTRHSGHLILLYLKVEAVRFSKPDLKQTPFRAKYLQDWRYWATVTCGLFLRAKRTKSFASLL